MSSTQGSVAHVKRKVDKLQVGQRLLESESAGGIGEKQAQGQPGGYICMWLGWEGQNC